MLARDTGAYRDTQNLLLQVVQMVKVFPKSIKYNIGNFAIISCIAMLVVIHLINEEDNEHRIKLFKKLGIFLEILKTLMEIGIDKNIRQTNIKRIARYDELVTNVGRQIGGWQKATQNAINAQQKKPCQS